MRVSACVCGLYWYPSRTVGVFYGDKKRLRYQFFVICYLWHCANILFVIRDATRRKCSAYLFSRGGLCHKRGNSKVILCSAIMRTVPIWVRILDISHQISQRFQQGTLQRITYHCRWNKNWWVYLLLHYQSDRHRRSKAKSDIAFVNAVRLRIL